MLEKNFDGIRLVSQFNSILKMCRKDSAKIDFISVFYAAIAKSKKQKAIAASQNVLSELKENVPLQSLSLLTQKLSQKK